MGGGVSTADQNHVASLIDTAKSTTGASRIKALKELWDLSDDEASKEPMCHPSLQLLPTLRDIITNNMNDSDVCYHACGILWYLTRKKECAIKIASTELNLLPTVMNLLAPKHQHIRKSYYSCVEKIFTNLSLTPETHSALLQPELRWISYLYGEISDHPNDCLKQIVYTSNFLLTTKAENVSGFLTVGNLPSKVFFVLSQYGSNPKNWNPRFGGIAAWCLNLITHFSCFQQAIPVLRQLNEQAFFHAIMESGEIEGIKATIIIANVYGKDENHALAKALLVDHESILIFLLDLFYYCILYDKKHPIIQKLEKMNYQFGELKLREILSALKNLSISDENKKVMILSQHLSRIIHYCYSALKDFVDNKNEYGVFVTNGVEEGGGGGQDFDSLQHMLELLLQLSFCYDDDTTLQSIFLKDYDLKMMLTSIMDLPKQRNLPFETRQHVSTLLNRLQKKTPIPTESPSKKDEDHDKATPLRCPQHVMFSYSWANGKSRVVALTKKMRELGYDIWRDEEGSSILPAMSGDIVEAMAGAIQNSYAVVIFVSPQYKESVNCRAEAKYARAREGSGNLKILYVMVDEMYHTRSAQPVDGWLGFMVGSDLWYPLWHDNQVESTAKALAELIGDNAKNENGGVLLGVKAIAEISSPTPVQAAVEVRNAEVKLDYAKAWECLSNPAKVANAAALQSLFDELGVCDASDFEGVDEKYFESIAILLKPAPQKNFRKALNLPIS